ncbi:hypothetical protein NXV50_24860 [Bacteroides thetaiotaomicron]|uniref:hypothetical protein n=1 Tax=Bacteroides thetaiotaomicron TaxID=818 RepID=UPI00216640A8|nr:hypothetical protein [Bacteroides thetaiotaomicron]MCS3090148.1 hypothetical protein [Bacteroides thetaiotaomicron]
MKKILLYASLATTALFAGCDLNINDDPNYPMNDQVTAGFDIPLYQCFHCFGGRRRNL